MKTIQETSSGDVLVELSATAENRAKFGGMIGEAIGESGVVRQIVPRSTLLIRNLDAVSNENEIRTSLMDVLDITPAIIIKISLFNVNRWGCHIAFVELDEVNVANDAKLERECVTHANRVGRRFFP